MTHRPLAQCAHSLEARALFDGRDRTLDRRLVAAREHRGPTRGRIAFQVVEAWRFLELALDAVRDLLQRVADGRARPDRLHNHRLDRKVRVLASPKP